MYNKTWTKLTKLQQVLFKFTKTNHPQVKIVEMMTILEVLCIKIMTHPQVFEQKFTLIRSFLGLENSPILAAHP